MTLLTTSRPVPLAAWDQLRVSPSPMPISGWLATLANHVVRVFLRSAQEEVIRPDAQRRVAFVTDQHVRIVDLAVRQLVGRAVSMCRGALIPELRVAIGSDRACPQPAGISVGLSDVIPQTHRGIDQLGRIGAAACAIGADLGDVIREVGTALRARSRHLLRPHALPSRVVAIGSAIRTHFAGAAEFGLTANRADVLDLRRVVLSVPGVAFREWHHR